jgi:hypothetical protein
MCTISAQQSTGGRDEKSWISTSLSRIYHGRNLEVGNLRMLANWSESRLELMVAHNQMSKSAYMYETKQALNKKICLLLFSPKAKGVKDSIVSLILCTSCSFRIILIQQQSKLF